MDDLKILEALERANGRVPFIAFVSSLDRFNPAPIYERVKILKARGFISFFGEPEMISITRDGFEYLRELRQEKYARKNDWVARIIAFISLIVSIIALCD